MTVPPELPSPELIDAIAITNAFDYVDGFHRVDWEVVRNWVDKHISQDQRDQAWNEAALLWVQRLRDDLGGNYFVLQSSQTILLCDQPLDTAQSLLDYCASTERTIKKTLGEIAWQGSTTRDVVLIFSDHDDYYQYAVYYLPEGESPPTGGYCLGGGYSHIIIPWQSASDAAEAIVHELVHDCMAYLSLPRWVDEGIAVTLEKLIANTPGTFARNTAPLMWHELAERHFSFWNEDNVQTFWAGTSFFVPGDSNELSYSLAEVFMKSLTDRGDATAMQAFLRTARWDDAGQTAAHDIYGADLGEVAGEFLGQGHWRPQRRALIACWKQAGWRKQDDSLPSELS